MRSGWVGIVVAALCACGLGQEAGQAQRLPMFSFDKSFDMGLTRPNGAKAQLAEGAMRIIAPANGNWPGVVIKAPAGKWDLSAYEYVSVDIHNIDTHDIDVFIRVDNPKTTITERVGVQPDQRVTLTVPLKRLSSSPVQLWGMNGYPQGLYPDKVGLDCSNIVAITPFTSSNPVECVFEISNVYAAGKYQAPTWLDMRPEQFFPFVDKFGQFMHRDWPGKVHSDEELQKAREAEAAKLAADKGPGSWDKWGGWANGPTLKASGHFRVEKHEGRWWLVDPDGKLFFSTGITCVGFGWAVTPVEERDNWFADLPPNDEANKAFYRKSYKVWSGRYSGKEPLMFDYSSVNLLRKYGEKWRDVYPAVAHQRLRSWGINTIGNWSDTRWEKMQKTPYTQTFYYSSPKLKQAGSGFPDPFAPEFAPALLKGANQFLAGTTDDPWCIGYFLDNEMPWGGETTLAADTIKSPANQAAKQEMIRWLKERYASIDELNKAWGMSLSSWDAFAQNTKTMPKTEAATKDLTEFNERIAEQYFKTVREVIKQVAPNKLYLGCRCVGGSIKVIASAIKYCDVVSYNRYCHSVREVKFPGNLDGPMMIGEFHFGASDRGQFWNGLVSCDSQQDRGHRYADYVRSALDNPQIVGTHWFQYGDEAVTGRGDGENAQCGFVDVCDTPYAETVSASREVGETMYSYRAAGAMK